MSLEKEKNKCCQRDAIGLKSWCRVTNLNILIERYAMVF